MRRLRNAPARVALAGFLLLTMGTAMVVSVAAQTTASAQSGTGAYEFYCPGTPVGNIVLNDVETTGTLDPVSPAPDQQFNLIGYSTTVTLPNAIASAAAALGNSAITGNATATVDASGATPSSVSSGSLALNVPLPSPVPAAGLVLQIPATPITIGPFTAGSGPITLTADARTQLTIVISGSNLNLTCDSFPNDSLPSGITSTAPSGSPISPVIASTGPVTTTSTPPTSSSTSSTTTAPASTLTGPYELYCPGTPVGNIVLNDVETVGTITPAAPNTGDTFNLSGYQTSVTLPAALASAAAAVSPGQPLAGSATGKVDVAGASPTTAPTGTLNFSVNIPSPVPASGVVLAVPSTPATLGPFTATSSQVTVQEDASTTLTLLVAGQPLTLTCTSFPNNSVVPSGPTTAPEPSNPSAPVIAIAGGSGTTTTTTTEPVTTTTEPVTTTSTSLPPTTTTTAATGSTTTTGAPSSTTTSAAGPTGSSPIQVGPGPQTTYTVQPQPPAGSCHYTFEGPYPLPDPTCTPGAISPAVTQANIGATICTSGYTDTIRPPTSITDKEKQGSATAYGFTGSFSTAEYDHLIPLEVGGDPNDASNLWVEPNDNPAATSVNNTKDKLENKLNSLVCSGQLTLAAAQEAIANNWVTAYQQYVGPLAGVTATSPSSTSPTAVATKGGSSSPMVSASSSALAFTGTGPGLQMMTLVGALLMLFGLLALFLVDVPRRMMRHLAYWRTGARMSPTGQGTRSVARLASEAAVRRTMWMLGR